LHRFSASGEASTYCSVFRVWICSFVRFETSVHEKAALSSDATCMVAVPASSAASDRQDANNETAAAEQLIL